MYRIVVYANVYITEVYSFRPEMPISSAIYINGFPGTRLAYI